jgi:hypothetical protein
MLAIDDLRKGLRIRYDFSDVHAIVVEPPVINGIFFPRVFSYPHCAVDQQSDHFMPL